MNSASVTVKTPVLAIQVGWIQPRSIARLPRISLVNATTTRLLGWARVVFIEEPRPPPLRSQGAYKELIVGSLDEHHVLLHWVWGYLSITLTPHSTHKSLCRVQCKWACPENTVHIHDIVFTQCFLIGDLKDCWFAGQADQWSLSRTFKLAVTATASSDHYVAVHTVWSSIS